jgi:hypothetical protein
MSDVEAADGQHLEGMFSAYGDGNRAVGSGLVPELSSIVPPPADRRATRGDSAGMVSSRIENLES